MSSIKLTVDQLIHRFDFEPLPVEGGLFIQTYCSNEMISGDGLPERYPRHQRPFGTAILYLFTNKQNSFSAMHKLPTDEIYHFYLGDPIEFLLLYPDTTSRRLILGQDIMNGQQIQYVVPRGIYMGARLVPGGELALIGTTMAPGFDESDYTGAERDWLIERFPAEAKLITQLTRPGEPLMMNRRDAKD
ncbi:MAG: cupin domain-containing protein [Anaerolineaceae bacterium]|nr:cupin domain-containing protein [Anaerolineaceae bacterium]